jgi:hypothetical protein
MDFRALRGLCRQTVLTVAVLTFCSALCTNSAAGYTYDFYSHDTAVSYNASTGHFTAVGYPETFDMDGLSPPDYNIIASASPLDQGYGQYNIDVMVNTTTGVPTSGTLTIMGALADDAYNPVSLPGLGTTDTLLSANISGISSAGAGELWFNFNVAGGDVVPSYFPTPGAIVQLHSAGSPAGNWFSTSFNAGGAYSDTYATPEPCTASLLSACFAAGLAVLAFRRRWKSPDSRVCRP